MGRGERRRLERELAATRPAPGRGKGWRVSLAGRRYAVHESPPADYDALEAESDAKARGLGCTCTVAGGHQPG